MKESITTHVVNYKDCIIVIKNVPCLECDQCGEKYYTDDVAEKLEKLIDAAKKMMQEIAVGEVSGTIKKRRNAGGFCGQYQ